MTDRSDNSESSSEDLIRQAREAFDPATGPETAVPSSDSDAPSSPEPHAYADYPEAPPTEPGGAGTEYQQPAPPAEPFTRPSDRIGPENGDLTPAPAWDGPAGYTERQGPSFFQRFGWLLVLGVIALGGVIYGIFDNTKPVEDLAVGDCLLMPEAEEISSVESAECSDPHELEVFALVQVPSADDAPYPGEFDLADQIFELCLPRFEGYVGMNYEDSIWWVNAIYPTQESWEDVDDREGTCVLFQPGADDEALTLSGSARGSAE